MTFFNFMKDLSVHFATNYMSCVVWCSGAGGGGFTFGSAAPAGTTATPGFGFGSNLLSTIIMIASFYNFHEIIFVY